ncbi:hypothetical protein SOVF_154390 [Spinacia oleracea]|uniref:Uncharacterized protein n=1 Tax=Spinacia oleracea TaxID=3562 RepID=A0A9R0I5J3_SPIOL|nr:uncharacterized protein LOC110783089 [Spinacia oleracea]KNA09360.1 hypothetical protein SOVF_154390 [Spinacia oleracea]
MKRIPRIKFPDRHPKPSTSTSGNESAKPSSGNGSTSKLTTSKSDVPAPPGSLGVGGKASLQPKRSPVSKEEMEAILLGGCV